MYIINRMFNQIFNKISLDKLNEIIGEYFYIPLLEILAIQRHFLGNFFF